MKKIIIIVLLTISLAGFFQGIASATNIYMQIISDPSIQFKVINPNGIVAGYDPASGKIVGQENFSYGYQAMYNEQTGAIALEANEFDALDPYLPSGTYTVIVYGKSVASYGNSIYISWQHGGHITTFITGIADVGKIDTYQFILSDIPNTKPAIVRVASANSLIADITAASKLGLIGNQEFVHELIKKIQNWQKEKTEAQKPEERQRKDDHGLIERYKELLKEITEKNQHPESDEFVKEEAYIILEQDINYIIAHIQ